jgi:DNA-binding transcriptional MerR regulator
MSLVSIGEFARLSRLSPKALRLYDELGLLVPAEVDAESGYRWYADTQLERARVVASLRRIRVPLARIRDMLALDAAAVEEIRAYWAETEAERAGQRVLVGHLVDRLLGKKSAMYEVTVRDIPARSLLSLMRRVHEDEVIPTGRELFIHRLARGGVPRIEGVAGAPFTMFHGEVSGDSDGPVEWCWPVPDGQAAEIAARFPDLTLRTEAAHQEVFVRPDGPAMGGGAQAEIAIEAMFAWAAEQDRQTAGACAACWSSTLPTRQPGRTANSPWRCAEAVRRIPAGSGGPPTGRRARPWRRA